MEIPVRHRYLQIIFLRLPLKVKLNVQYNWIIVKSDVRSYNSWHITQNLIDKHTICSYWRHRWNRKYIPFRSTWVHLRFNGFFVALSSRFCEVFFYRPLSVVLSFLSFDYFVKWFFEIRWTKVSDYLFGIVQLFLKLHTKFHLYI